MMHRIKHAITLLMLFVLGSLFISVVSAQPNEKQLTVLTNYWPPYINQPEQALGSAAAVMKLIGTEINSDIQWQHLPYDYIFNLVKTGRAAAGFPYFKTTQRSQHVLFSDVIFKATSKLYFNRQFVPISIQADEIKQFRIGKVSGYSYGESLDSLLVNAQAYPSELQAIAALFANDVDLLPMTEGVMSELLSRYYPDRTQLIRAVPDLTDQSSMHLIAPNSPAGHQLINTINQAIQELRENNLLTDTLELSEVYPADIARLLPGEGYPAILGRLTDEEPHQYLTLPIGTKVIVTQWSHKILSPVSSDRIFRNMNELSKVVVLNGPHTGKALYVRNLHINLE